VPKQLKNHAEPIPQNSKAGDYNLFICISKRREAAQTGDHPWRCLWRGSLQMTRTTRFLRMILQLRQTFLTEVRTFMFLLLDSLTCPTWRGK
jgi:hypothetical protein